MQDFFGETAWLHELDEQLEKSLHRLHTNGTGHLLSMLVSYSAVNHHLADDNDQASMDTNVLPDLQAWQHLA